MNRPYAHIIKIVELDPATGVEDHRTVAYGVVAGDDHGYAVTRSADTLEELRQQVGDLTDDRRLWEHAAMHHPHLGDFPLGSRLDRESARRQ